MREEIKPVWYFTFMPRCWRIYIGRLEAREGSGKHLVFNIGLYFMDFGYAF